MKLLKQRLRPWHLAVCLVAVLALGAAAYAAVTTTTATGIHRIVVKTSTSPFTPPGNSNTFFTVTGAQFDFTLDEAGYIRTRFSAESQCGNGENGSLVGLCIVRVKIGGTESNPKAGADFVWDTAPNVNGNLGPRSARSMERISDFLTPGTYTVSVQARTTECCTAFTLDDWTMSIEALPAPPS